MESVRGICQARTQLAELDIEHLERLAEGLQVMADLNATDIFIDCLVSGREDRAVVVAQARPQTGASLYSQFIIGQTILKDNEPGVFHSFATGQYVTGTRAITNENVTTEQKVLPIVHADRLIAVLIMEQDISTRVLQEHTAELFQHTAEHLGETLWEIAVAETNLPTLIHEGVILCNSDYLLSYINPTARAWLARVSWPAPEMGMSIGPLFGGELEQLLLRAEIHGVEAREFTIGHDVLLVKAITIRRGALFHGGLLLISDITELRQKEKQLMIKSAVMKEIHHRVKNNLQTVSSLLRLQMRRTGSAEIQRAFQDSISRIKTMALVHETLSRSSIEVIEVIGLVERIVAMLVQTVARADCQIHWSVTGDPVVLASDKATPIALVVNELLQNCIDHAFVDRPSGCIQVRLKASADQVSITVWDNGSGIDRERLEGDTLGIRIVRALVEEDLGGELTFANENGTKVTLVFPCHVHDEGVVPADH